MFICMGKWISWGKNTKIWAILGYIFQTFFIQVRAVVSLVANIQRMPYVVVLTSLLVNWMWIVHLDLVLHWAMAERFLRTLANYQKPQCRYYHAYTFCDHSLIDS